MNLIYDCILCIYERDFDNNLRLINIYDDRNNINKSIINLNYLYDNY